MTIAGLSRNFQNSFLLLCFWREKRFFGEIVRIFTVDFSFSVNCLKPPQGFFTELFFIGERGEACLKDF